MQHAIICSLIVALPFAGIALLWLAVFKPTIVIVVELRAVQAQAESATTLAQVNAAWAALQVVGAKCWHRSLSADANAIAATLRAKHQLLSLPA